MTMDYILQLRQLIGTRPILMVGAAILVVDRQQRLLLMKRSDSGCWGQPGGATESGERVEQAAKRELDDPLCPARPQAEMLIKAFYEAVGWSVEIKWSDRLPTTQKS